LKNLLVEVLIKIMIDAMKIILLST